MSTDGDPLRETLLRGNAEENVLRGHGAYLVDRFKVGHGDAYPGVDWVTGWYNRNLRILANLQRITESPDERLLPIIGGGHLPIGRHCVLASPEYDLVEPRGYLAPAQGRQGPAILARRRRLGVRRPRDTASLVGRAGARCRNQVC